MKFWVSSFGVVVALITGMAVHAQSIEQSTDAYLRGDYQSALAGFRVLAERGDAKAQFSLGRMYAKGKGVPQNAQEAFNWVRKAAEQGYLDAQAVMGTLYVNGQGVTRDSREAVNWFLKAAEHGHANAQYNLGVMYAQGEGVVKDLSVAANWYRKAAEQGEAPAQHNLGVLYANGDGVIQDTGEAVNWYRKAAELGLADAQAKLGLMYFQGIGVDRDAREALRWFRKAAEQGNASAQNNLGVMYFEGQGASKDDQLAYFWWLLASANGDKNAVKGRNLVEQRLPPAQRASAQVAARNWKPKTAEQAHTPSTTEAGEEGGMRPTPNRVAPSNQQADSTGSGFRITRGVVVTNHHVIDSCSRLHVNGIASQVRGSDARSDLALLNVALAGPSTSLRAQRAAIGESVAVAGYPLRGLLSGFNMTTGNLSSLSGVGGDTRLVQITAPVQPGNSGGPLLDSAGNLMGVVVSKLDAIKTAKITGDIPQNVNFAINANVLRSFLDAYSVDYETGSSERAIATTAIAEKAKGFTVLVECWK